MRATKNNASLTSRPTPAARFAWLGVPDDLGIQHVGGRIGAAQGPSAFRAALLKLRTQTPLPHLARDGGDVGELRGDIEARHRAAAKAVQSLQSQYKKTVVVGGGHDHGYSQLLGVRDALSRKTGFKLGCINVDAHFDLRRPTQEQPLITSGSPFFLALERGILKAQHFVEFGIQTQCNRPELWQEARSRRIRTLPMTKLRWGQGARIFKIELAALARKVDAIVVSMDLDAVCAASAPGVSAPQAEGFDPSTWMALAEEAGRHPKVVSLGIFELSPPLDRDDQTAKLAATTAYRFWEAAYDGHSRD